MPGINPEKCYVQKPEKMHVEESLNMPVNWFVLLVNIIADDILKLNSYDKIVFFSHLDERIGSGSTYSLKKQLLESIAVILSALTKSETSVDKKLAIATKLSDGVSQCTPGFHNRVNEVVTSLTIPDDFDALLAVQRKSIVSNAASLALSELNQSGKINKASEIHTYNRYFTIACGDGYGVRALNDNDWYHGQLHDEKIQGDLQAAFVNKFTLFHVLNGLLEQIAEIVKSRGYSGTKQDGYEYAEFSKFDNEFFASYIYISTDDLFVTKNAENATPVITDINWKNVRLALLRKLQTEKYFIFDCQEEMLLDVLFNNAEPTENTSGAIKALISNHEELMQALIFMNCHFPDKMEVLVSEYLKGKVPDDEKIVLDKIDKSNLSMANEKFQFCIKNLRLVRAASLTDAAYAKKLITQGADVNVALGLLLGKSQSHTLRWLHENPKIRETINVVGLSKTIPDLNHKSVAQVLVECRKGCQLLAQDQVLREACEKIIGRDIYHDYMRKYHDDKYYQHTGLYAKKVSPIIKSFLRLVALGNVKEVINVLSGYKYLHRELLTARLAVKNKNGEYVYGSALEIARANIDIHHFEQGAKLIDELVACIQRLELPIQHQIMQEVEQDGYLDRVKDLMARHFPANFKELKDKESVNYERALSDAYNKHYRNLPVRTVQAFIAIHEGNILSLKNDVMLTFKDLEELRNASGLLLIDSAFYDDQQVVLDYLFSIVLHQYNISSKEELDALTAKNQPHILHYAVLFNQSSEVMEALIRSFGNVDAVLNQSSTPLHLAVRHGRVQHAHTLINHGANINALTYQNISVLHLAINSGSLEMVDLLLKHHAETDTICKGEGYAALHRVVIRGDIQLIELLLDHGVNVNAVTASGETALHIAAGKLDFHGIIKILLERGANLHLTTPKDHCTPFKIAMSAKNYRNALVLYAHELFERPDYHFQNTLTFFGETLIEFGHSADVKKKALRAFIDVMEGQADMETLMQYEDALNNGRLGKIVKGLGYEVSAKSVKPGYRNLISF